MKNKAPKLEAVKAPSDGENGGSEGEELQPKRKDHVLQARVDRALYENLVKQARRLRVPVSNLVRNILEDSVRMVENIVDSSLDIAEVIMNRVSEDELKAVLGWQPMLVNRDLPCQSCGTTINKDQQAFSSIGSPSGKTIVICSTCKEKL